MILFFRSLDSYTLSIIGSYEKKNVKIILSFYSQNFRQI